MKIIELIKIVLKYLKNKIYERNLNKFLNINITFRIEHSKFLK